jgi:hypothetical protein
MDMQQHHVTRLLKACDACANADASPIWTTLYFNGAIGIVLLLLFERFRHRADIYFPRLLNYPSRTPDAPPSGFGGWMKPLLVITDEQTLDYVGLDGYMRLKFLKVCALLCCVMTVVGLLVLAPVYSTGYNGFPGYYKITMSNVSVDGVRLWAPWLAIYIYSGVFLLLLHNEYKNFCAKREKFLAQGDRGMPEQVQFSVLVEKIPRDFRSNAGLQDLFQNIFPGHVHSASVCRNLASLDKLVEERHKAVILLEKAVALKEATGKEPEYFERTSGALCCKKGVTHEAIPFWQGRIDKLNEQVTMEQYKIDAHEKVLTERCSKDSSRELEGKDEGSAAELNRPIKAEYDLSEEYPHSSTGFVTLSSKLDRAVAYQVLLTYENYNMRVFPAPEPREMVWKNAIVPIERTEQRRVITNAIFTMGVLMWGAVLAFIAALSSIDNLTSLLPFLEVLKSIPVIYPLLQGYLPTIVLIVFQALLATIIAAIGTGFEGIKSISSVQVCFSKQSAPS